MRRKTDDELKQNGTWRRERHGQHEPAGELLTALPPPPEPLDAKALEIFNLEGGNLIEQKMLKASDIRLLAAYSVEMSIYYREMRLAEKDGATVVFANGIRGANPHRKAGQEALKLAWAIGEKLGLSPSARAKLVGSVAFKNADTKKHDPILDLLKPRSKN